MPLTIQEVKTHLFDLPVLKKRTDAIQSFASMETLVVELRTSDGLTGTGYGYTIGTGGRAAKAYADHELKPLLDGEDCEAHQHIWDKMFRATRASGGGPISSIARAAVPMFSPSCGSTRITTGAEDRPSSEAEDRDSAIGVRRGRGERIRRAPARVPSPGRDTA